MLTLKKIERVDFDPANKQHREAINRFMVRNSWEDAGIKFTHDPMYGSIVEQTCTKLVKWYLNKELSKKSKTK